MFFAFVSMFTYISWLSGFISTGILSDFFIFKKCTWGAFKSSLCEAFKAFQPSHSAILTWTYSNIANASCQLWRWQECQSYFPELFQDIAQYSELKPITSQASSWKFWSVFTWTWADNFFIYHIHIKSFNTNNNHNCVCTCGPVPPSLIWQV